MKAILLLFVEPYIAGARDSEKFFNPDLTKVSVTANGSPNRLYNEGLGPSDLWEAVRGFFVKKSNKAQYMNATKFYTADKFGLLIDLRSMSDPGNLPFNDLVVGPTNSGKSQFVVDQLFGRFHGKFDFIMLICPTFAHNKTFRRLREKDLRMFIFICQQREVETWLRFVKFLFESTNTLIVLDDCAASKDVKSRMGKLVSLAFSARHMGISVLVLTQKYTSITASFRENVAAVVLFYTPAVKTMKSIFEDFAGELTPEEYKTFIAWLKKQKYSYLVFSLRHPFGIKLHSALGELKNKNYEYSDG